MSRFTIFSWLLLVFALIGLAACGNGTQTKDPSLAYTQIWLTVEAAQTQTGTAIPPTPAVTNTPEISSTPRPTHTPLITDTPLPGVPTATIFSVNTLRTSTGTLSPFAATQNATCDNPIFVSETYTDGSEIPAGSIFIKTWTYKNMGPCSWNQDYRLIFGWGGDGTNWNTTSPSHFATIVLPGETIDISVSLAAPITPGTYGAYFRMQNDKGFNFGPPPTVSIVVK